MKELRFDVGSLSVTLVRGDLLELDCDALICPIDRRLSLRDGVAAVIHKREGSELARQFPLREDESDEELGAIFSVKPTRLKARSVFFAVTCDLLGGSSQSGVVGRSLDQALSQAELQGLSSVALPPLGHPALRIPYNQLAEEIFPALREFAEKRATTHVKEVRIVLFNDAAYQVFGELAEKILTPAGPAHATVIMVGEEQTDEQAILGSLDMPELRLICFSSIEEALAACRTTLPDCVIVDHDLLSVSQHLRKVIAGFRDAGRPEVGTIVIGNPAVERLAVEIAEAQIDAFVSKPMAGAQLRDAIALALQRMRQRVGRQRFAQSVYHDLKSPLSVFKTGIELIEQSLQMNLPLAETHRILSLVKSSTAHMESLIRDLTDWSAIQTGHLRIKLAEISVTPVVESVCRRMQVLSMRSGVRLELEAQPALPAIHADAKRLEQVFENLISNSLKHAPGGGKIGVTVRQDGDSLVIAVTDTGHGVDPAELEKIFDPFYQAKSSSSHAKGTGLGLAISREIIQRHGGKISASSEGLGRGLRVELRLPVTLRTSRPQILHIRA